MTVLVIEDIEERLETDTCPDADCSLLHKHLDKDKGYAEFLANVIGREVITAHNSSLPREIKSKVIFNLFETAPIRYIESSIFRAKAESVATQIFYH